MLKTTNSLKRTFIILLAILVAVIALSSFIAVYYGKSASAKRFMRKLENEYKLDLPENFEVKSYFSEAYLDGEVAVIECYVNKGYELKYDTQFTSDYRKGEFDIEKVFDRVSFKNHSVYIDDGVEWWGRETKTTNRYRDIYVIYNPYIYELTILFEVHQYDYSKYE